VKALSGERSELENERAGNERAVDVEKGIHRGGADEPHGAAFHVGQQHVLLGFVEAVDFVDEKNGAGAVARETQGGGGHDLADFGDGAFDAAETFEAGMGGAGDDFGEAGFSGAGRTVENDGGKPVGFDGAAEQFAGAEDVFLSGVFLKNPRAHPLSQRRVGGWLLGGGFRKEVVGGHDSVNLAWTCGGARRIFPAMSERAEQIELMGKKARAAARALALVNKESKNAGLMAMADAIEAAEAEILAANAEDLAAAPGLGLNAAAIDRLRLTPERIGAMAKGVREVAVLPDPCGEIIREWTRPNGLKITKIRVPIGVVGIIYESRPNVTADAAVLCVKSGNACILRGGKEAIHSNSAIARALSAGAVNAGLSADVIQLVAFTDREGVRLLAQMDRYLDVIVPRGGHALIEAVVEHARMPVIKHYHGVCHVFVDREADLAMAENIVINAKCQRPGVCNALETLLVHRDVAEKFLPSVAQALRDKNVELRGDERTRAVLGDGVKVATEADWTAEYLDLILSVRVVDSLEQAIDHIESYGSHHSDAIVTANDSAARKFLAAVDSAAVFWNASTRFSDGGEFGFGAEIGISTDKLHARGPMGLEELTTYKYLVSGAGQVRG
jgi:glutamate-5-semialdehyde dehydrogenase